MDRAQLLTLTAPEMTVLVGGLRVLNANADSPSTACSPNRPETLTNDFFVNLLDMARSGRSQPAADGVFEGRDRADGRGQWRARRSISCSVRTRSFAPSRKSTPATTRKEKFVNDFVAAWTKVMNLDRFDIA